MNELLYTIDRIRQTGAEISHLERRLSENRDDLSIRINLQSLQNKLEKLEEEFSYLASQDLQDVCSYRLIPTAIDAFSVSGLSQILGDFQTMLTVAYDALKTSPKTRARSSIESVQNSQLQFGYTFSGSLGFVFTVPNERLTVIQSDLDRAIEAVFSVLKAEDTDDILQFARTYGAASIRKVYGWASSHIQYGLSADIRWQREQEERAHVVVQTQELTYLCDVIDRVSDIREEELTIRAELLGADVVSRRFHLQHVETKDDIRGQFGSTFQPQENDIRLQTFYTVRLKKNTTIRYSTEEEEETWELLELK